MERWIRYYQVILAGLIGSILAVSLVSLTLSAYQVSQGILRWSDLSNIGEFWNGHLGMVTLVVIAVGLYVQARQFDSQLHIERQERLDLRREHAYTVLQLIEAKIERLTESVQAFELGRDESGLVKCTEQKGLWGVVDALRNVQRVKAEDYELWVDERVLDVYIRTLNARVAIWKSISALNIELGAEEPIDSFFLNEGVITGEHEIAGYLDDLRKERDRFFEGLRSRNVAVEITDILARMTRDGWRIAENHAGDFCYASARCFEADKKVEVAIYSEGFRESSAAFKELTEKWQNQFAV